MSNYDRMKPDGRLLSALKTYSQITYGVDAYPLSTAEATFLIREFNTLQHKMCGAAINFDQLRQVMKGIADKWNREANRIEKEYKRLWKDLESGKLPQVDETIYRCYQLQAQAETLRDCANELLNKGEQNEEGNKSDLD